MPMKSIVIGQITKPKDQDLKGPTKSKSKHASSKPD